MLWFEITANVPPGDVDAVAALMRDAAPGGVTVEEPVTILGPEMGFLVREGEPVAVRAYLPASELGAVLTEDLRQAVHAAFPEVELVARPLYEQDWAVSWREFFGVVDYGGRIVIVPSWVEHAAKPGQLPIKLDPGQAFGTGHHETTRLCLAALEEHVRPGASVLDVGTGSGVLTIAACQLGAGRLEAIDVDPVAIEVARGNLEANGVEGARLWCGRLERGLGRSFDVVVANISTEANIGLAGAFGDTVTPGGTLLLSGLLATDARRVAAAMDEHGFTLTATAFERDWCLLALTHRAGSVPPPGD